MFTTDNIKRTPSKFNDTLSKRTRDLSDSPKAYQSLSVIKRLSKGKFPVYLTSSNTTKQKYVMKMFSYSKGSHQLCYQNEVRFASLSHPNIVDMVHHEQAKEIGLKTVSVILMEYAPYGDFFDFILNFKDELNDEKLVRTYFRQLIDGIEYLHESNIAHLDLKPENLLIGADFSLKITDFDLSHVNGDVMILSRGTRCCRGPEFFMQNASALSGSKPEELFAADIYSAGVILFMLKCGMYPHAEGHLVNGVSFVDLIYNDNSEFWSKHCEIQRRERFFFSADFKELFNSMVKENPNERITISQIKKSKWYNGPIYAPMELCEQMKTILKC